MTKTRIALLALTALFFLPSASLAHHPKTEKITVSGLERTTKVLRDDFGVPHVFAKSDHDAYFMVGYLHAQDRLFQMDSTRRQASGTLAELLGSGALGSDVQLRTLGLRRAAVRSQAAITPEATAVLEAYAKGVNAWIAANPLPSEYTALELTKANVPAWTALDSLAVIKLLAFGLSFDDGDIGRTQRLGAYQTVLGPVNGTKLFSEDVMRSEPFAHAPSIFPGETSGPPKKKKGDDDDDNDWSSSFAGNIRTAAGEALENLSAADLPTAPADKGSNIWVVSGKESESGRAMVASDPHLSLGSPATFYEVGVDVDARRGGDLTLYGVTFPGTPAVVHGTNGHVSWGSTVNPTDVTDIYAEQLTIQGGIPVATTFQGALEPTQIIPESYRVNLLNGTVGDVVPAPAGSTPPATVVVPRRNNGPLISVTGTTGLSVQFTGFSATREVDFFRLLSRADTVHEAIDAQRYFDFGAQNWMYVDDRGNIGYKTSAEIPLREDLQAGTVTGLPPYFIRNGVGGNEWIKDPTPAEDQATPFELLPFAEMDGLVNPKRGWIANANQDPNGQTFDNDPLNELRPGGGIRYITPGHEDGNRNARVTARLLEETAGRREVSFKEMQSIQADVRLNDAAVLVPYITAALQAAQTPGAPAPLAALGADPKVQEAVARLAAWDFSTPTGIPEGYDASDPRGFRVSPTQKEIDASVAATIHSLWRSRALAAIVDGPLVTNGIPGNLLPGSSQAMTALRHLLETNGTGASGIVFFAGPAGRDTAVLGAVKAALDLAASPGFAPAFGGSTNLADYRWGKLHRIVFRHTLGGPFSIPPGAGFVDLGTGLPGVATDGGFSVPDASSHNPRASTVNAFMFGSGPARRFVAEARREHPNAVQVIPGGESGNPAGPWFGNQLGLWLTNDYHDATTRRGDIDVALRLEFKPAP
jgi:penicillin amidase